jgi:hypothetical protein
LPARTDVSKSLHGGIPLAKKLGTTAPKMWHGGVRRARRISERSIGWWSLRQSLPPTADMDFTQSPNKNR